MQGRCDEVFRYPGVSLPPHVVRSVLLQSPDVAEYQVCQLPGGVAVTVVPADPTGKLARFVPLAANDRVGAPGSP